MRASFKMGFCYIANTQCASTSIRTMLDPFSEIKSMRPFGRQGKRIHHHVSPKRLKVIFREEGRDIRDLFLFSSVRNPFSRMVSRYYYGLKNQESVWNRYASKAESFLDFIKNEELIEASRGSSFGKFLTDNNGRVMVDDMIRVEHFEEDTHRIFKKLGIERTEMMTVNVNRVSNSYREYYDDEAVSIVEDIFSSDIKRFGYSF